MRVYLFWGVLVVVVGIGIVALGPVGIAIRCPEIISTPGSEPLHLDALDCVAAIGMVPAVLLGSFIAACGINILLLGPERPQLPLN